MSSSKRLLFGTESSRSLRFWVVPLAVFVVTFAAYATDAFAVSGGVVWVPGDAAVVGLMVCAVLGYLSAGFLLAWASAYAGTLAYHADHYFLSLSSHSRPEQLRDFLALDGLVALAVIALLVALVGFALGRGTKMGKMRVAKAGEPFRE